MNNLNFQVYHKTLSYNKGKTALQFKHRSGFVTSYEIVGPNTSNNQNPLLIVSTVNPKDTEKYVKIFRYF